MKKIPNNTSYWNMVYWILMFCWIIGALLSMNKISAGFLSNYLSDITFPPWFYIQLRGLNRLDRRPMSGLLFGNWFGLSPWRAGISIFIVGLISELLQLKHFISGIFDINDILAYAVGLFICMVADRREN